MDMTQKMNGSWLRFSKNIYTRQGLDATNTGGSLIPSPTLHSRGSIGNTGGSETRPRNIAFNYIVRAA
ncbi:hypothetical protein MUTS14_17130 [Escherichia coli]|nr:hypothetical protein MUTS14_17130 [Escherichia coli]